MTKTFAKCILTTQYFKQTFIGLPENLVSYARTSSSQIFLCQINQSLTPKIFVSDCVQKQKLCHWESFDQWYMAK